MEKLICCIAPDPNKGRQKETLQRLFIVDYSCAFFLTKIQTTKTDPFCAQKSQTTHSHSMNSPAELNVTSMAQRPDYACASISAKQIIEGMHAGRTSRRVILFHSPLLSFFQALIMPSHVHSDSKPSGLPFLPFIITTKKCTTMRSISELPMPFV